MPTLPPTDASDEEWRAFAEERCEELKPHVAEFILERFTYKPSGCGEPSRPCRP